jgi:tRNA(adenine34) deaminase
MTIAISQAKKSLLSKDFPVGAVLVVNGKYVGKSRNSVYSKNNWTDHAELKIIRKHSNTIKNAVKEKKEIILYTTLEPCFMCFGTAIINKITKIIYACPDPSG